MGKPSTDISRLPNKLSTYKHKHLQTQTKPHFRNLSSWRENADALALQAATAALAVPAPAAENKFPSPTYLFRMHLRFFFSPAASHDSTRNLISLPSLGFSDLGWRDIVLGMDCFLTTISSFILCQYYTFSNFFIPF